MTTEARIWPDVAIPPGETLAETLKELELSQAELARRTGRPVQAINEIVRGTKEITSDTALQFEMVLGVPAHFWSRLEADYKLNKARLAEEVRLKKQEPLLSKYPFPTTASHIPERVLQEPLLSKYPFRNMASRGWVDSVRDRVERVRELLRFFGVASLYDVETTLPAAFRKCSKRHASPQALAAWLRQGEREAQNIDAQPFSESVLRGNLPEVRTLTTQSPQVFEPRLKELLASSGVALVLVPHLPKTYAHGAARWIRRGQTALVQMSIRYKWDDIFWFSLFHELGHVLLHDRGQVFVEYDGESADEREREADEFATEQLIPTEAFTRFVAGRTLSQQAVLQFSREQGIAASIVVGRLQHDGRVPHSRFNRLRARLGGLSRTQ